MFCGWWNELVHKAQVPAQHRTGSYAPTITTDILGHLRKSYIALHESADASLFFTSIDDILTLSPGSSESYTLCSVQDHCLMFAQTSQLATASFTDPPSSRTPLFTPPDSNPQSDVAGATEDANDASVSSLVEAISDPTVAPFVPKSPRPPLAACSSVELELTPAVQESQGQTGIPLCRH
jgi:hypothetical protein